MAVTSGRIGAGAIVQRADGRILIGRRRKSGEPVTWCLPGGHVEPGETFEAGALRELTEEAGLRSGGNPRAYVVAIDLADDRPNVTAGVLIELGDDAEAPVVAEPDRLDQWVWADPEDLPEPLFPASAAILAVWRSRPVPADWAAYRIGEH
jgi:ADP-ribose pyrophosphatase YjhB (NUDIX family)